jgi:Domain of unknown function DUF488
MADRIFTFGYEGMSVDAFVRRLKASVIEAVLDVRTNPLSRKPGFSKRAMHHVGMGQSRHTAQKVSLAPHTGNQSGQPT